MKKKANILTENIIFLVLNIVFLMILVIFLFSKTGSAAILEEKYAKKIALAVDSAKPGMIIHIDMKDAINEARKQDKNINNIVVIEDNIVLVKLREKGGYEYSFFNDVEVNANLDTRTNEEYYFVIG